MKFALLIAALLLSACTEPSVEPGLKAIVGGRIEPSRDAEPIPYGVIVIAAGKIRAIGPQATTPVPKGAETSAAKDKIIRPAADATLAPGAPADLAIFTAGSPTPERIMQAGEWTK